MFEQLQHATAAIRLEAEDRIPECIDTRWPFLIGFFQRLEHLVIVILELVGRVHQYQTAAWGRRQ